MANTKNLVVITWELSKPSTHGAEKRLLSLVQAMIMSGFTPHLLQLVPIGKKKSYRNVFSSNELGFFASVHTKCLRKIDFYVGTICRFFFRNGRSFPAFHSPLLLRWIKKNIQRIRPTIAISNCSGMIALMVNPICSVRMLDCVDIWTLHLAQIQLIGERFPWRGWEFPISTDPVLQETCFQYVGKDNLKSEMDLLSQYNSILTISCEEADEIRKWVHGRIIETIPMCAETMFIDNTYDGPPLILGHNHPFNAQAYAYFIQRVLPFVHLTEPDFAFRLIGKDTNRFPGHPSVDIAGFVEDIVDEYRRAAFLMVPVLGGTGQLTRVVEAMAHGLPVVATRAASRSSPIRHGYNGFIADTAEEFAEFVVALNRDRQLARSMGQAALETVRTECSMEHLKKKMSAIIERM